MRSRPGRSVTSILPSGRKARPQGWLSPRATVSTVRSPALDGKFWAAAVDAAALSANMAAHDAFIEILSRAIRALTRKYQKRCAARAVTVMAARTTAMESASEIVAI